MLLRLKTWDRPSGEVFARLAPDLPISIGAVTHLSQREALALALDVVHRCVQDDRVTNLLYEVAAISEGLHDVSGGLIIDDPETADLVRITADSTYVRFGFARHGTCRTRQFVVAMADHLGVSAFDVITGVRAEAAWARGEDLDEVDDALWPVRPESVPLLASPDGSSLVIAVDWAPRGPRCDHDLVLHADWRVEVPHALDADRAAGDAGGTTPCAALVYRSVPAARHWLALRTRAVVPLVRWKAVAGNRQRLDADPARRSGDGRWAVLEKSSCCRIPSPQHLRSLEHHIARHQAPVLPTAGVASALARAHGLPRGDQPPPSGMYRLRSCVDGRGAGARLWDIGYSPERVRRVHDAVGADGPLSVEFYRRALSARAGAAGLVRILDDPELA